MWLPSRAAASFIWVIVAFRFTTRLIRTVDHQWRIGVQTVRFDDLEYRPSSSKIWNADCQIRRFGVQTVNGHKCFLVGPGLPYAHAVKVTLYLWISERLLCSSQIKVSLICDYVWHVYLWCFNWLCRSGWSSQQVQGFPVSARMDGTEVLDQSPIENGTSRAACRSPWLSPGYGVPISSANACYFFGRRIGCEISDR